MYIFIFDLAIYAEYLHFDAADGVFVRRSRGSLYIGLIAGRMIDVQLVGMLIRKIVPTHYVKSLRYIIVMQNLIHSCDKGVVLQKLPGVIL